MAIKPLNNQVFRSTLASGKPNSLGTLEVYVAGTGFATLATIYSDAVKTSELDNPVTLSSNGEIEAWLEVDVDYRVRNSGGTQLPGDAGEVLAVQATTANILTGNYNLVTNPSAELDIDTDTLPDNWTLALQSGGTITSATTAVAHGAKSFKFTGSGAGAGTATSDKFDVLEGKAIDVAFSYQTDAATSTNSVKIKWYTKADALVSTTTVYSATTGQPSAFTTYYRSVVAPATATRGEVVLGGIENGGTVETGTTYFDNVRVSQANQYTGDSSGNPLIYDANGNPILKTVSTPSSVNYPILTNAATGNNPSITAGAEDVGLDIEGVILKNADVDATTGTITTLTTNAITAETTDGDLAVTRNGTGEFTVDSTPIYGLVILDAPEILINDTTPATTATSVNSTTLNTALAKIAILEIDAVTSGASSLEAFFASATFTKGDAYRKLNLDAVLFGTNEFTVNLDSNFDFWYQNTISGTLADYQVRLIGYYV